MYTQCPDCEVAFKVTADALKQAAGQVRCGGCGNGFNALSSLSENMPDQAAAIDASMAPPELLPELAQPGSERIQSISAEHSAALLKTLDELAGSDIRIEDTGVEWRVLDEDEAAARAADDQDADPDINDEGRDTSGEPVDDLVEELVGELRFDDNTPLLDDVDADAKPSFLTRPSPSIDLIAENDEGEETPDEAESHDIALSEPDEWQDLLGEFQNLAEAVDTSIEEIDAANEPELDTFAEGDEASAVELELADVTDDESILDEPEDLDTGLQQQADAMEFDLSIIDELADDGTEADVDTEIDDELDEEIDDDIERLDFIDEKIQPIEEPIVESHAIEEELAADEPAREEISPHHVPPMTEEEHTVNMQIDQDLMALAIEDEDGFASTIIIPEKDAETYRLGEPDTDDDEPVKKTPKAPLYETIVMEGEAIRFEVDREKLAADAAAAAELVEISRAQEKEELEDIGGPRYRMIAAAVLLGVILLVQMIHQSREALATIPVFNNTIGQLYRVLGQPVQPSWDITGWRFEATKGSTEGEDEDLTVYSRLGNNSDGPLPYPLIGISLTDRFEESIGSRVLEPAEYLQSDMDPRKLVEPGDNFDAVITIKSASADATGFKLNVCYRLSDEQLRCAIDDFK